MDLSALLDICIQYFLQETENKLSYDINWNTCFIKSCFEETRANDK